MTSVAHFPDSPKVPLGELLCDVQSGFASGDRAVDGVIQIRMNNVTTSGNLDWTSFIRVPATEKQIGKYHLQPGDVLFNSTNSPELVGKTTVFEGNKEPVVFSNHFLRLRVDRARLDARFLARWFTFQWQQRTFEGLCTQWVNQATVRKEDLLALSLPLPPLDEQKRISAILSKADRLRRLRRYARELSDGYLQSVFLEMFGDPVSNPRGWEVKSLADLKTKFAYGTSEKCYSEPNGLPVLRIPNILGQKINLSDLKYAELSDKEVAKLLLAPGDLVFVRTNGNPDYVGRCAVFDLNDQYLYASYLIRARLDLEKINPRFLETYLHTSSGRKAMSPYIRTTAGQSNIGMEGLGQIPVPLPPLPLQQKFAQVVQKYERLRAQQRESARQGEHLFQSLLHRAFRGEV